MRCEPILLAMLLSTGCATHIHGVVVGPDQQAISGHMGKVNFQRLDAPGSYITDVDASGHFRLDEALPDGDYLVEPLLPLYKGGSQTIRSQQQTALRLEVTPVPHERQSIPISAQTSAAADRGDGGVSISPPRL